MKVSSKFDVGDGVWYVANNKVQSNRVRKILINVDNSNRTKVSYTLMHNDVVILEDNVFGSKEELIKSL